MTRAPRALVYGSPAGCHERWAANPDLCAENHDDDLAGPGDAAPRGLDRVRSRAGRMTQADADTAFIDMFATAPQTRICFFWA